MPQGTFALRMERLIQSLDSLAAPLAVMYAYGAVDVHAEPTAHGPARALDQLDLQAAFVPQSSTALLAGAGGTDAAPSPELEAAPAPAQVPPACCSLRCLIPRVCVGSVRHCSAQPIDRPLAII